MSTSRAKLRTLREAVRAYRRAVWAGGSPRIEYTSLGLDVIDAACDLFPTVGRTRKTRKTRKKG